MSLFNQYVFIFVLNKNEKFTSHLRYPNLHEVRHIAAKKDIAFIEYLDENSATIAKEALHNFKLEDNKIKVCGRIYI